MLVREKVNNFTRRACRKIFFENWLIATSQLLQMRHHNLSNLHVYEALPNRQVNQIPLFRYLFSKAVNACLLLCPARAIFASATWTSRLSFKKCSITGQKNFPLTTDSIEKHAAKNEHWKEQTNTMKKMVTEDRQTTSIVAIGDLTRRFSTLKFGIAAPMAALLLLEHAPRADSSK